MRFYFSLLAYVGRHLERLPEKEVGRLRSISQASDSSDIGFLTGSAYSGCTVEKP